MNSKSPKNASEWQPCAVGSIQSSASTAAVVVVGGFAGWSLFGQKDELGDLRNNPSYLGGIACSEVKKLLAEYANESLTDVALVEAIDVHLGSCSHCRGLHNSMTKSV